MNEFVNSFLLRNTYRTNAMLYYLKQIPFLTKWNLYKNKNLKTFIQFIAFGYEVATIFIWKVLYLLAIIAMSMLFTETLDIHIDSFFHILFFLTFCGAVLNTSLLEASTDKYYAIILMKMDARRLALSEFIYFQLRQFVGLLIAMCLMCSWFGLPFSSLIYVPLFIVSLKIMSSAILILMEMKCNQIIKGIIRLIICVLAIGLLLIFSFMNLFVTEKIFMMATFITVILAIPCLGFILKYPHYHDLYRKLLAEDNVVFDDQYLLNEEKKSIREEISDVKLTSNLHGFAYLNDLFVKRHKKILMNTTKWITFSLVVFIIALGVILLLFDEIRVLVNQNMISLLPYFLFIMYLINRGESVTKAMFINCDQAMLHYSFYRKPKAILDMFTLRLCSLVSINLLPAVVLAAGLVVLYIISGPANSIWEYVVIFVTILCLSIFYSIHYLALYYLLQPYNSQMEVKNPYYQVATGLTYFIAYVFMEQIDSIYFGVAVIGITVLYCNIALLLAYKLAPKTFKLK